ncbi:hypothetical protein N9L49_01675, partial [Rhodospirillales bacterium]|nr:hypothetical protein [Rhodospirillales bacterium]
LTAHESISIAPRDFVRQCDKHFHKIMETYDPDGDEFSRFPSQLSWKIPNSGRLFHCYHQHPIAISVDPMNLEYLYRFRTSLDEDYISSLFSTLSHVYLCKDSDEVAVCSLSEREFWIETVSPSQIDTRMVIWRWAERYASLIHRSFVRIPYTWHWDDVPDHLWSSVEEKANQIIGDIAERLYLPDSCIKVEDMIATRNRELRIKQMKSKRSYGIGSSNFNPNDPAIDIHPISIPKKLAYKFFTLIHMFIMSKPFETGFLYTLRTETVAILKRTPFIRPILVKYTEHRKEQSRTVEAHAWTRWHTNYTSKNRDNGKN